MRGLCSQSSVGPQVGLWQFAETRLFEQRHSDPLVKPPCVALSSHTCTCWHHPRAWTSEAGPL